MIPSSETVPPYFFNTSTLPGLSGGPNWRSFEQFRREGSQALDGLKAGAVGTLSTKVGCYRILHDEDFQRLIGLAAEVHRLRGGVKLIVQAVRVVQKHPDRDSLQLLINSAEMLTESSLLPERDGHGSFELTEAEEDAYQEDFDLSAIPRPQF